MKKVLSVILALMLAGTLTLPAFAAEGDIIAEEVKINAEEENLTDALKVNADDEEGMLRISPSTLLKIKLKLEGDDVKGKDITFLANKKLENGEQISADKIQFIEEKTIADDGTVNIQFRPRANQPVGIYNMRANVKNASMFSRYYKTIADQIQPSLSKAGNTVQGNDIEITVSDYTDLWKDTIKLYEVKDNAQTEIPAEAYSFEKDDNTSIATLKINTTGEWATEGTHTLRFVPTDKAYNPITFTVNILEPERVESALTASFVSSTGEGIPAELNGITTLPEIAKEKNTVEFTVTAPKGYDITSVASENAEITEADGKYSFTMPDTAVSVTVTLTPKTYTLTLDLQGGEGIDNTTVTGTVEDLISLPSVNPTKFENDFAGWYTAATEGTPVTSENFDTIEHMLAFFGDNTEKTMYAQWVEHGKFKVSYSATETGVEGIPTDNTSYDQTTTTQIDIPSQEPTRMGYTFKGWKVDGDSTLYKYGGENAAYTNISAITGTLIFKAQWEIVTYTITLQDGADSSEISGTIENLPELIAPSKEGYEFKGYFTAAEGGNKIEAITVDNIAELNGQVLYVRWEEIQTDDYEVVSIDQTNSKVNVIKRTDKSAWIIVATYTDKGHLVKATIKDISSVTTGAAGTDIEIPNTFDGDYATVKVFMWNNLSDMTPRCDAISVEK